MDIMVVVFWHVQLTWRWRLQVPLKCLCLSCKLYDIRSRGPKCLISIVIKTLNPLHQACQSRFSPRSSFYKHAIILAILIMHFLAAFPTINMSHEHK